jgi:hypothetical protein
VNAVRAVLSPDAEAGDAHHRLALRFYRDHPDLFKTDRRDGFVWVEPRPAAFHLTASKHSPKHTDDDGMALSNAKNVLGRRRAMTSDGTRGVLLDALAAKRDATEDEFVVFRDRTDPSNHLLVPFATRFNSPCRVREARQRFDGAWRTAAERFDRGVVLTLTTDPARFDSLAAATETLMDDVNRLKAFANRFADGSRPPSVVVPEFTEKGFPHVHVALFGEGFVPHAVLSDYWDGRRDRGSVVWCDAVVSRGDCWLWAGDRPDRADGRGPRAYLGKTLGNLEALAATDPETVHAAAGRFRVDDAGDNDPAREWWKLACYWATETRLFTTSPSLRPGDDGEASARDGRGVADGPRWQFVGVARYDDLPAHVTRDATLVRRERRRRPPPGIQNRSYETSEEDKS